MTTLLVIAVGTTDVQVVDKEIRRELPKERCGELHDELEKRGYKIVETSTLRKEVRKIESLPAADLIVCAPKLDLVLNYFGSALPANALIFETRRTQKDDPRLAGRVLERRLKSLGVQVRLHTYLRGKDRFDDSDIPEDAVVRRSIVADLSSVIAEEMLKQNPSKIVLATTGGPPPITEVLNELVRLHAVERAPVVSLETPRDSGIAVEEKFHPAAGYRARWHALSLVENGNLLGAWGAVSHLEGAPGQEWTQVIRWLARFASSLPLPKSCDLAVLSHKRMAVRAGLRVELALRAGDIPRAVHGTVAFFETALWDHLSERTSPHPSERKFRFHVQPPSELVRVQDDEKVRELTNSERKKNENRPFIPKDSAEDTQWYWIDDKKVPATKIAEHYLKLDGLSKLAKAVDDKIRDLRNDASHNEPTPELMDEARTRMQTAALWSSTDTFLSQPLVQAVLRELGEATPETLLVNLLAEIRRRLVDPMDA